MARTTKRKLTQEELRILRLRNLAKGRQTRLRNLKKNKKRVKKVKEPVLKYPIIKEVELHNKGRQGKYVYVLLGKGDKAKYFKKQKGLKAEDYIEAKKTGILGKKKGVQKKILKIKAEKKIKGKKRIEQILHKGVASVEIKNAQNLSLYNIRRQYRKLLLNTGKSGDKKPIVRDHTLIDILTEEQNVNKFKHRLGFVISIKGEKGENLVEINYIQTQKNLREVINDIKDTVKIGMDAGELYKHIDSKLKPKGYTAIVNDKVGRVKTIDMKMVYRKG